jgi:hypothetical protein
VTTPAPGPAPGPAPDDRIPDRRRPDDDPRLPERRAVEPTPANRVPDYRVVLRRLTALADEAARHRAEAERWHDERVAAADEAERAAEEAVRQSLRGVREAQRELEGVDARAAGLWSEFVHRVGPSAERFGRSVPEPVVPRQRGEHGPEEFLQEVATRLAYTPPTRPLTNATQALFALFGALGGAVGFALSEGLRWAGREAGGDWAVGLPVVALIVMLTGPVLGVDPAKRVADRRGSPLDAAAVAVVLISGLVTAGLLYATLRSP